MYIRNGCVNKLVTGLGVLHFALENTYRKSLKDIRTFKERTKRLTSWESARTWLRRRSEKLKMCGFSATTGISILRSQDLSQK